MRHDLYRDLYVKEQNYWWHVGKRDIVYALVDRYLKPGGPARRRALDIGCGAGLNLDRLAHYALPVGTDFSEEALRFCRHRGHSMLCKADAARLPFAGGEYDLITALDVVEHLDDDVLALAEMARVLKPGGLLVVSVPAYRFLWSYWDDILGHRRRYTARGLASAIERAGLAVSKVSYSNALILAPSTAVRIWKTVRHKSAEARSGEHNPETDFVPVPRWVNWALIAYYRLEARVITRLGLPFGLSVVAVARKPLRSARK